MQQHFNLTNGKLVYCFHGEFLFLTKLTSRRSPNLLFFAVHKKFRCEERVSSNTSYIWHIYKQPTEYISKKAFQQAGGDLFSQQ